MGIPRYQGLGSDAMTGLAVARTLALLAESPIATTHWPWPIALGLARATRWPSTALTTAACCCCRPKLKRQWPAPLRWRNLEHDDDHAWVWVLHWPDTPPGTPPTLEADRMAALLAAART